eukprot:scaffold53372_cov52-Attheya_sp.AAC.1
MNESERSSDDVLVPARLIQSCLISDGSAFSLWPHNILIILCRYKIVWGPVTRHLVGSFEEKGNGSVAAAS